MTHPKIHPLATVIHGPPGSGKTRYVDELCAHYGCTDVVDDWPYTKDTIGPKTLVLTQKKTPQGIDIKDALKAIGKLP